MMLKAILPFIFKLFQDPPYTVDWNLVHRWAGPCSFLLDFGLSGWLLGHFFSRLVYRGSPVLLGFGPLVDYWGVGFGP